MADLATAVDVAKRLGRPLTAGELGIVEARLPEISASVRQAAGGVLFEAGTDRVERIRPAATVLRPSQSVFITAVSSVVDGAGVAVGFSWAAEEAGRIDVDGGPWELPFVVTYDHGPLAVPSDIVGVTCNVALRILGSPYDEAGETMATETRGSHTVQRQRAVEFDPAELLESELEVCGSYSATHGAGVSWQIS